MGGEEEEEEEEEEEGTIGNRRTGECDTARMLSSTSTLYIIDALSRRTLYIDRHDM